MRWYIVAASALALTACREGSSDKALGSERDGLQHGGQPAQQTPESRVDRGQIENYQAQERVERPVVREQVPQSAAVDMSEIQSYERELSDYDRELTQYERELVVRERQLAAQEEALRREQAAFDEGYDARAEQEPRGGAIMAPLVGPYQDEYERQMTEEQAAQEQARRAEERVQGVNEQQNGGFVVPPYGYGVDAQGTRGAPVQNPNQPMGSPYAPGQTGGNSAQPAQGQPMGSPYAPGQSGGTSAQPSPNQQLGSPYTAPQQAAGARPGQVQGTGFQGRPGVQAVPGVQGAPAVQGGASVAPSRP
ncbi:hypothetical protein [Chondromyces crocatus]|uniref:Uncharacterized protein n=1 Tax=Chondromyces crocatus TaxID=52 RepID=A0A0K1E791_CHOCO|nr:hypothetical protein [Chondromyces crocatus]AKT36725.1 uncharacterized protein CMC5_008460 [Chondromyces crocatus]